MHNTHQRPSEGIVEGIGACRRSRQCHGLAHDARPDRASASSRVARVAPATVSLPSAIDGRRRLNPLEIKASSDRRQILKRTIENLTGPRAGGPGGCEAGVPRLFARSCPTDGSTARLRPQFLEVF